MPVLPNREQDNTNVYHDRAFREMSYTSFLEDLYERTGARMISNFHLNKFDAVIRKPEFDRSKIVVGMDEAYQCEIESNSNIETSEEVLQMDKTLHTTYQICQDDEAYITLPIREEASKETNRKFLLAIDAYIFGKVFELATETTDPITDIATAESVTVGVSGNFIQYESVPGQKVIIAPHTMYAYFRNMFTDRIDVMGDDVFQTGQLRTIDGWTIYFVAQSQLPAADADSVIYAIGKPVDTFIDEAGFMEGSVRKQGSTPDHVNFNFLFYKKLNLVSHIWAENLPRVVISRTEESSPSSV